MRTSTKLKLLSLQGRIKSNVKAKKIKKQEKENASRRTYSYGKK